MAAHGRVVARVALCGELGGCIGSVAAGAHPPAHAAAEVGTSAAGLATGVLFQDVDNPFGHQIDGGPAALKGDALSLPAPFTDLTSAPIGVGHCTRRWRSRYCPGG